MVPAVLSAGLVYFLREPPRRQRPSAGRRPSRLSRPRRRPPLGAGFWRVVGVLGLFSLVNFPDALLLLRLHDIGFGVPEVILAYVGYNVVYTVLSYPAGVVADRLEPAARSSRSGCSSSPWRTPASGSPRTTWPPGC